MILNALDQWQNTLLKFIGSCKSRGSHNAGYNRIILHQDQIKTLTLNGKLQKNSAMKCLCPFFRSTRFHCLKFLNFSRIQNKIRHQQN